MTTDSEQQFASIDFSGRTIMVTRDQIHWRPAAYGLVLHDNALLVVQLGDGRFVLPGGGIDKGEWTEDALRRELFEETGVRVRIERFRGFREELVYIQRHAIAIQTHRFFYDCTPLNVDLTNIHNIPQAIDIEKPSWLPAAQVAREMFLFPSHAEITFDFLRHHQLAE